MQSEEFDKKIKDAAEYHHPAYDDKAWMKMEQLLDKHMPVEKERKRRFLLILFFFLLLGGGTIVWFGTANFTGGKQDISQNNSDINEEVEQKDKQSSNIPNDEGNMNSIVDGGKEVAILKTKSFVRKDIEIQNKKEALLTSTVKKNDPIAKAIQPEPGKPAIIETMPDEMNLAKNKEEKDRSYIFHLKFPAIDSLNMLEINKAPITKLSRKKGIFFVAASIAPDLSVVGLSEMGKIRTAFGFGLGYTRGRISIRSGFYSERKVYEAYPEDYKAPAAFYSRYPNLQEVKADCKVYEIPLLLSYNLRKAGNSHWFLTTGISSYLIKRETYDYFYKWNLSGPVVHRERTIRNANQHYFSVVTFSAGYQRSLSKKISLVAEPYLKIPMTGIGFGKVKLNSAGVLISVTYKPFGKK